MRRAARGLAILAVLAVAGLPLSVASQTTVQSIAVIGTQFRITLADGRVMPQSELPGTIISLGDGSGSRRYIRIDAVERDPKDQSDEIVLYRLSERGAAEGEWHNLCQPDPDGKRLGFPLAGRFTPDGRYIAETERFLITCTGGAEGKCIRFGYHPWGRAVDGTLLRDAYNACVRLVRADYSGDGRGTTRNGQPIDIYDVFGIQQPAGDPHYAFEAGWTANGAVCVNHVRVPENVTFAELEATGTWLAEKLGASCTEASARADGAIVFVRSPL